MNAKKTLKFAVVKITLRLLSICNWFQSGTTWQNSNALILQWEVCKTTRATYSQEKCGCICAISLKCFRTILRGKPKIKSLFWFHKNREKCCKKIGLDFLQKPQPKPPILCWGESVRAFFCSHQTETHFIPPYPPRWQLSGLGFFLREHLGKTFSRCGENNEMKISDTGLTCGGKNLAKTWDFKKKGTKQVNNIVIRLA